MRRPLSALILLAGCNPWNLPHQSNVQLDEPLWDPAGVIPAADGLYVPLPHAGALALLSPGDEPVRIDIGEGRLVRSWVSPDLTRLAAVVETYSCSADPDDVRRVDTIDDCPADDLEVDATIAWIQDGEVQDRFAVDGQWNSLVWSDDGAHAIAWLDLSQEATVQGVVNLTSVVVLDFEQGTATTVPVGFAASRVLFDEANDRAVVLSQSSVAVIDLASQPPVREVTFSLTLDPDQVVVPVGVALTPDGRYGIISVSGSSDLYVLDLELHAVNIVSLTSAPAAMQVDPHTDTTVLVYAGKPAVEVLEHTYFDVETIALDEPMTAIVDTETFVVLSREGGRDVYKLDTATRELTELRLQNPLLSLEVAPTAEFAIAFTTEGSFGGRPYMEVLDLRDDRGRTYPYLLETRGVGVAFDQGDGTLHALVLQNEIDYLYQLDLYTAEAREVELAAPPIGIGDLPSGGFYITHDADLGLVSFLDPATGEIEPVAGFAALGIADPIEVADTEEE